MENETSAFISYQFLWWKLIVLFRIGVLKLCLRFWRQEYFLLFKLELIQNKNDSIQSKKIPILKLPLFFISYTAREKSAAISNLDFFWTEWNHSYIVLALVCICHFPSFGIGNSLKVIIRYHLFVTKSRYVVNWFDETKGIEITGVISFLPFMKL